MGSPFVGEIRIFACNFAPTGWAHCHGQLLPISQNTALFSLLGTNYGGDGKSTFGLPDLQTMAPLHWGQGPGLSDFYVGDSAGEAAVTLIATELPAHVHTAQGSGDAGTTSDAANGAWAGAHFGRLPVRMYAPDAGPDRVTMSPQAVGPAGGGQPHNNMPPYLVLNFCIALQGVFPPRG